MRPLKLTKNDPYFFFLDQAKDGIYCLFNVYFNLFSVTTVSGKLSDPNVTLSNSIDLKLHVDCTFER